MVIIGLDGATWDIMLPLIEQGKLPALKRIMDEGQWGKLRSVIPPVTAPAWATMLTGCNPGEHGVFAMTKPDAQHDGRHRAVTMADWKAEPLWSRLNARGLTTGFLGVPFTYPPPQVNGWMISGIMGTPRYDERMCNPASLFAKITEAVGSYPLLVPIKARNAISLDGPRRQVEWTRATSLYLLEHHSVDVFMVVETYTDHLAHSFFNARTCRCGNETVDLIEYAYRAADELVASVRAAVGDDCPLVIVSDHGMGPLEGFINLEAALNVQRPVMGRSVLRWMWRAMVRLLPASLLGTIRQAFFARSKAEWSFRYGEAIITLSGLEGTIRVAADDEASRSRTVDRLVEQLGSLRHPVAGHPIIQPLRGDELYSGRFLEEGPSVIAWPIDEGYQHILRAPPRLALLASVAEAKRAGVTRAQLDPEGCHRLDGVFLTNQPAPDEQAEQQRPIPAHLQDVCGYCLDICLPGESGTSAGLAQPSGEDSSPVYSEEEHRLIQQRLADLGYL